MKIKQHVVITDPAKFLKGQYYSCFTLFEGGCKIDGWIDCGEVTLNIEVDSADVIRVATDELDEQISKANAVLSVLEQRKAELLALPGPGYDPTVHSYEGSCELCEGVCQEPDPADKWEKPEESLDSIHSRESKL